MQNPMMLPIKLEKITRISSFLEEMVKKEQQAKKEQHFELFSSSLGSSARETSIEVSLVSSEFWVCKFVILTFLSFNLNLLIVWNYLTEFRFLFWLGWKIFMLKPNKTFLKDFSLIFPISILAAYLVWK